MELDAKSNHILDAALPVFVRHGFRKASMADIARAANISRASLYLSFGSKEELFRAGSTRAHARTMRQVEAALGGNGDVFSRIESAIAAFHHGLIAPFASSSDAVELFEVNMALAKDITLVARATLVDLLAQALADAEAARVVALDRVNSKPVDIANVVVAAMDGIKHAPGDEAKLQAAMQLFMRLLRAAIS
ncbi:TetR/AcrR family transcriptional regulator [Bradyrhizobium sp. AUGA SZCCT0240]|jgi:AcrR family transcriptional regulator|uniref:TetR/AcrR family transcriptional regulator n=1 Tax=unclassified Bradyrhizobium TaxID=2631580 RepID=UPI001BA60F42|nr:MULTISPECIES: TetR/AcrR family transcriptional regulator [unclassified Bradyrhizobium]MBR1188490.1 TetR/AcrR family transcriptional regulator [Bradyrhizobium sp. AUGA SZCCT0160]MBR1201126.1 TetR/AcrR family transcriptional regulator [Bradyrhizobium sp. AUGA SZCCT0158]MBR1245266.1 TetR/AcrR family transcriptional regulator [Bradyrhizobium sp. AUGA SZCCT0274]MBR1252487.1 TetR/AcrR family transcriptional regulator [Bradyrhizobium sp. AUGA SZCCT0240]